MREDKADPLQVSLNRKQMDDQADGSGKPSVPAGPTQARPSSPDESAPKAALAFESDQGASRSKWIAAALLVAIVVWMGSGFVIQSEEEDSDETASGPEPVTVAVVTSKSEPVMQFFRAEGQALPDRETMLLSETTGEISEVLVKKGALVEAGQVIAKHASRKDSQGHFVNDRAPRRKPKTKTDSRQMGFDF